MMRGENQQSRLFYELCALALSIMQLPSIPATVSSSSSSSSSSPGRRTSTQISPAAFASLLLGVSLALMFCGSVTFVLGFILMPWVLGLVMVLYFVGIVSNLSLLGRALLSAFSPAVTSPSPPPPTMARSPKQLSGNMWLGSVVVTRKAKANWALVFPNLLGVWLNKKLYRTPCGQTR